MLYLPFFKKKFYECLRYYTPKIRESKTSFNFNTIHYWIDINLSAHNHFKKGEVVFNFINSTWYYNTLT